MKHLLIVDINQAQRDDLIARLQNVVPGSDGLYRVVLNATETQRLTTLRRFSAVPAELSDPALIPSADPAPEPTPAPAPEPTPAPAPVEDEEYHHGSGHRRHKSEDDVPCTCHLRRGCKKHRIYPQGDSID